MMHHDTISGTSPGRVIQSAIDKLESLEIKNSMTLVDLVSRKIRDKLGLNIEGLN